MQNGYRNLRIKAFSKSIPYDHELANIVQSVSSHKFLLNPASQNTYLYQVEFVHQLMQATFGKPMSQLTVLDWGCGKGQVSFLLKRLGAQVISCDYCADSDSDDDSAFGQTVPIVKTAGISIDRLLHPTDMPYCDKSFDSVLSFGVLEHVQDDLNSMKELRRILRPGGMFFCFNLPYFLSWTQRIVHLAGDSYHDRLYNKSLAKRLLSRAGFEVLDIWHRQLFPKNRVRYPFYRAFEAADQLLVRYTPLRYLATNIEFVAVAQ